MIKDAHDFLIENYKKFDFIWSSPPCLTHSTLRFNTCVRNQGAIPKYPDLKLYEEILFLKYHFKGFWLVENVKPYYPALIRGRLIQRHLFWSNFYIEKIDIPTDLIRRYQIPDYERLYSLDLSQYKIKDKRKILRNCVNPKLGAHILKSIPRNTRLNDGAFN